MIASMIQNIAEFSFRTGDWDAGLREIDAALTEDWDPVDRLWLIIAATPIRALRGADVSAELAEIAAAPAGQEDVQAAANVAMARGMVALAHGDLAEARRYARQTDQVASVFASVSRPRAARMSLWLGDLDGAREDLAVFDSKGVHGPAIEADRDTMLAGIAAGEGRTAEAIALYRDALRDWQDLGLALDEALIGLDMVQLLDPTDPEIRAVAASSREILLGLGATTLIARLDAALESGHDAGSPDPQSGSTIGRTSPIQRSSVSSS
jgi:tetratricopeptide (TPR) repeat protein